MNAGNIVIAVKDDLLQGDINIINNIIDPEAVKLVWVGDSDNPDIPVDLRIEENELKESMYRKVKKMLAGSKIIFEG